MALAGRVVAMTGEAFVIAANGNKRKLHLGDQVELGDTIETPRGVDVDLELNGGRVIHIVAEQQVWLNAAITETTQPSELDSAVDLATIDTVIKAIESGNDIGDVIEETAAGPSGATIAYGFGFVDLLRFDSDLTANSFNSSAAAADDILSTRAADTTNLLQSSLAIGNTIIDIGTGGSTVDVVNTTRFTDKFVNGVSYTTSSGLSGLTGVAGVAGQFNYRAGDEITFKIGNITIAKFSAAVIQGDILFLQDIAGTTLSDTNSMYVENMAIFLQALAEGLQDSNATDGVLRTNAIINNSADNINITQAVRDLFATYANFDLSTSDKVQLSRALAFAGVEFTEASESNISGNNVFETMAMQHVVSTIQDLAGARTPATFETRQVDQLDIPGGVIKYSLNPAGNGVITFTTNDLLVGAVGRQSHVDNLVVSHVKLAASFLNMGIGQPVYIGNNTYTIQLDPTVTPYQIENLAIDYRVSDWTVFRDATSSTLDTYKSHLSAQIADVQENAGFTQFTIKSSLAFDTDQQLTVKFSPENGLGIAEYSDDFTLPIQYSNNGGVTWQNMQVIGDYTRPDYDKPLPLFAFNLSANNQEVLVRMAIFDDPYAETGVSVRAVNGRAVEVIDMLVEGDNFYAERLQPGIIDNDPSSNNPIVEVNFAVVNEGDGFAVLTVYLVAPGATSALNTGYTFSQNITVDYVTQNRSAIAGLDYTALSGTATILAGQNSAQIRVPIIDDNLVENLEFLKVNLSNVSSNAVLGDPEASIRIYDNDGITVQGQTNLEGNDVVFQVTLTGISPDAVLQLLVQRHLTLSKYMVRQAAE